MSNNSYYIPFNNEFDYRNQKLESSINLSRYDLKLKIDGEATEFQIYNLANDILRICHGMSGRVLA